MLAEAIARSRRKTAVANYAVMGGGSPLLAETMKQAEALGARLAAARAGGEGKVFVAMR